MPCAAKLTDVTHTHQRNLVNSKYGEKKWQEKWKQKSECYARLSVIGIDAKETALFKFFLCFFDTFARFTVSSYVTQMFMGNSFNLVLIFLWTERQIFIGLLLNKTKKCVFVLICGSLVESSGVRLFQCRVFSETNARVDAVGRGLCHICWYTGNRCAFCLSLTNNPLSLWLWPKGLSEGFNSGGRWSLITQLRYLRLNTSSGLGAKAAPPLALTATVVEWL